MQLISSLLLVLTILHCLHQAQAGFRCRVGGNLACSASCVTFGQTSGICDSENDCNCSEKSISLDSFKRLLPSRCNLGLPFCQTTCNALGRESGACATTGAGATDCECSDNFISPKAFALCAAESTCRLDCQRQGFATGECFGWACKCQSQKDGPIPDELKDLKE
eukprot:GFUD01044699.1.p1 GENE.GFUD01044699.1~~GFUD01044699.1.p1  ORF type:complete len:165 (+),score=35.53 GFUD01044699.1:157-651(+)